MSREEPDGATACAVGAGPEYSGPGQTIYIMSCISCISIHTLYIVLLEYQQTSFLELMVKGFQALCVLSMACGISRDAMVAM
jgi:hypothetical protein